MAETYSAGIVTAYGAAVRGGYTGTYEQWCQDMANLGDNVAEVREKAQQVEQTAQNFTEHTVPEAVQTIENKGTEQVSYVNTAGATQVQAINEAGTQKVGAVESAGSAQIQAVNEAGTQKVSDVTTAGINAVSNIGTAKNEAVATVQAESTTQQSAIQQKGEDTIASIPSDYTELSEDVNNLKSALSADESLSMRSVSFDWVDGDFNGQGEEISSTTYKITDFIDAAPLSAKMNGATKLYIYYYDKNKNHISHENKNVDYVFTPNKVAGCKYYRLNTKGTNVPLLTFEAYSDSTFAALNAQNAIAQNQKQLTIKVSDLYERGQFVFATGKLPDFSGENFSDAKRVAKYLRVVSGTTISVNSFSGGTLYCFEYDASKNLVTKYNFVAGSKRQLDDSTLWVRFEHDSWGGDEVTVTFVSPSYVPSWGFEARVDGNTINFGYQVFPCYHTDTPDTVTTLTTSVVITSGLLMLPPNYTENGEKVPVIYFAHGSADYHGIAETEFSANYMDYLHYLRDEGYAIFDCYGWTNKYTLSGAQMANPTNMAAIKQGLQWVAKHFNVDINRVYVTGKSLGGLQAINMCYEGDFPIKACCPLAPALDAAEIGFGYSVAARKAYAADLCFSEDTGGVLDEEWSGNLSSASAAYKAYALANADKLLGYNPIYRNLIGVDASEFVQYEIDGQGGTGAGQDLPNKLKTMSRICNIPTKIIMAVDDNACSPTQCSAYIQSIKNAGGVAEMRWMPANTGKHHAVDTDANALKVASITTKCGVTYSNVPLAYADMVQFFRRYS